MKNNELKNKIIYEMYLFFIYTLFFAFFFFIFGTYKRLILGEYAISYIHDGYSLIEALILSKIVLFGKTLKLGERFQNKPLIYPVIYKTIVFTFLAFLFSILEHFVVGYFKGEKAQVIYQELLNRGLNQILASLLIVSFVFFLFFSIFDLAATFGERKIFNLFFKKNFQ